TFGDGGTSTQQNPTHTYATAQNYTATLVVTDNQGAQSNTSYASVSITGVGGSYRASTDFSSAQGYRNWYYLESTGAAMSFDSANNRWQGSETYSLLWAGGGHPGNAVDAVLQWRTPSAGTIRITGNAADGDPRCGD